MWFLFNSPSWGKQNGNLLPFQSGLTGIENKLVATSGEKEGERSNIEVGKEEVQTTMYNISCKDILYNTGNVATVE